MKKIAFLFLFLVLLLAACGPSASDLPFTSLLDLNKSPQSYQDQDIKVQGQVTEFLGEDSHIIALPYITMRQCKIGDVNTICQDLKISFSQVRVAEFKLQSGDQTIVVSEQSGGMYLPIPFVPAGHPTLPAGEIQIVGRWSIKQDGSYVLYVSGANEISATATPTNK